MQEMEYLDMIQMVETAVYILDHLFVLYFSLYSCEQGVFRWRISTIPSKAIMTWTSDGSLLLHTSSHSALRAHGGLSPPTWDPRGTWGARKTHATASSCRNLRGWVAFKVPPLTHDLEHMDTRRTAKKKAPVYRQFTLIFIFRMRM